MYYKNGMGLHDGQKQLKKKKKKYDDVQVCVIRMGEKYTN